jgi:hypothetical protein
MLAIFPGTRGVRARQSAFNYWFGLYYKISGPDLSSFYLP